MLTVIGLSSSFSQPSGYTFTDIKRLPATSVKNQFRSGTCWSFSAISFFESELLRMGKGTYDLSEMYAVRKAYGEKAKKYVRMHGSLNFGGGGAFNDVTMVFSGFGIVPEETYSGLNYGQAKHVHGELDLALKSYIDAIIKNPNKELSTAWYAGFEGLLDAYFGPVPGSFNYNGKKYDPVSFSKELGLSMNDYVMISSFTHHPYYLPFILEVPDNWGWGEVYNVTPSEMTGIIDHSVNNGYTVAWATDVSEKGFNWKMGLAVVPSEDIEALDGLERSRWDVMSETEKASLYYDFSKPRKEKVITAELRQQEFDNLKTTDDHGMHIIGLAKDQLDNPYYIVKNSWSEEGNAFNGYLYASRAFVQLKTTSLLVHKNGIPPDLRKKLGL
jgi:bleomycin hydrolase